jgi:hypothetical protein
MPKYTTNIPAAREHLEDALKIIESDMFTPLQKTGIVEKQITAALSMMTREIKNPAQQHEQKPRLDWKERSEVRLMYASGQYTQAQLATLFNVNHGRINEAINENG